MNPLTCLPNPCDTCPYRRDTPPGIWAQEEYDKLPTWDEQWGGMGRIFMCHNGDGEQQLCRGWMEVHEQNIQVRIAMARVKWDAHNSKPTSIPLYSSGAEARRAGMSAIKRPPLTAQRAVQKLQRRRSR